MKGGVPWNAPNAVIEYLIRMINVCIVELGPRVK
jgi:hypothetical protein